MIRPVLLLLCSAAILSAGSLAVSQEREDPFSAAMGAWRFGNWPAAEQQLSAIISTETDDARVFYFRGILAELQGRSGDNDFASAARLEVRFSQTRNVNRSLEKTQGPLRAKIERFRVSARNAIKPDPVAAQNTVLYRDALAARSRGDLPTALALFEQLTNQGQDPRYYYLHGVTLFEAGELEKARAAFALGLEHEKTPDDVKLVNQALAGVQGEIRRLIEEETQLGEGEAVVTRQSNQRALVRRAQMTEDQLLAESNAAARAAEEMAAAEETSRRIAAAERLREQREAREETESRLTQPMADADAAVAAADAPSEAGATAPPVAPDAPAAAETDSSNPFLGGAAVTPSVATSGSAASIPQIPVDMSWLPASSEYLMMVRPAEMLNSGFVKPLTDSPQFQQQMEQMKQQMKMNPADVESVTMGMANLMATLTPVILQAGSGKQPDPMALQAQLMGGENTLMVVRTINDVDIASAMQTAGGTAADHDGKTIYALPSTDSKQPQMSLSAVDGRTFLVGSEAAVKAALTNGPGEANRPEFAFASAGNHMVQAFSSPLLAGMSGSIPDLPATAPPFAAQLLGQSRGRFPEAHSACMPAME